MTRFTAIALTVLTGFSGLVYEVSWQKYLATLLGSQGEATAAILAIFLGGLSAGYSLFGRMTRRIVERARGRHRPPRLLFYYGLIEAGIGVYALLFPTLYGVAQHLSLLVPLEMTGVAFGFDVILATLLIGPPAVLMGSTIPVLTLGLAGSRERATRIHALIYGCNTAGAFIGALVAAFILIPRLGLDGVQYAMGSLNAIAGFVFVLLDRFGERVAPDLEHGSPVTSSTFAGFTAYAAIALLAGFAMMALQTTFNRIGGLSFGASHFTFAIVVAVFVLCIALGSFAVSPFRNIPRGAIAITQWALVAYLSVLYVHVQNAPYWSHTIRTLFRDIDQIFYPYYIMSSACILLVLVIPIGLSGALLPLLFNHLRGEVGDLGAVAGRLYSWNTLGSLLGALLGGYLLLFWFDLHHIYRFALAALILESALLTKVLFRISNRTIVAFVLIPASIGLYLLPAWSSDRLSAGLFRRRAPQGTTFAGPEAHFGKTKRNTVAYYNDDPTSTVTVRDMTEKGGPADLSIYLNGKSDGNSIADYQTTSLLALIPALMAEKVERCFVIGFGTGVTTGELAALDWVQSVEVAEISPGVIEASPLFDRANLGASSNPKVRIRRGDAYRTLMRTKGQYDVIVSEPSNPWVSGVEMLYSAEFLEAARAHLAPGGVYAQWMHLYSLDVDTIELVLRTYNSVFPFVSVWVTQPKDLLLMGFESPERALDVRALEQRFGRADFSAGMERAKIESMPALLSRELLPLGVLKAANLDGALHTLRHPRLSDRAARSFIAGIDANLPKFPTPASAQIGARNSLLRRYAGGIAGPLPTSILEAAVRERAKLAQGAEVAVLLAQWRLIDPGSEDLYALIAELRGDRRIAVSITEERLSTLAALLGGRPLRPLGGPQALARARRISRFYLSQYDHAAPFQRRVLEAAWADCRMRECAGIRRQLEKHLGNIDVSKRRALPHRNSAETSPLATDPTDATDASASPHTE